MPSFALKFMIGAQLSGAPPNFKSAEPRWRDFASLRYTLQVSPEDCTGCRLCVEICPAKEQKRSEAQGHQHGRSGATSPNGKQELGFLPVDPRFRSRPPLAYAGQGRSVARAAIRIFRRVRGLRRNSLHQAPHAIIWRPRHDRQRHRLLFDLRRKLADHALHFQFGRARPLLVQFLVRRQRRIRPGHAPGRR